MENNRKLTLTMLTILSSLSLWSCVQPGELDLTSHPAGFQVMTTPPVTPPPVIAPMKDTPPPLPELMKINRQARISVAAREKVDVLFVDDNSKSMMSTQKQMALKFNHFIDTLDGLDWQLAITTTDVTQYRNDMRPVRTLTKEDIRKNVKVKMVKAVGHDGRFLQFPNGQYMLNSSLSKRAAQQEFASTIQRRLDEGGQWEQGVKATYRSIERISDTTTAEGRSHGEFFRPDASLAVVFISDADESLPPGQLPEVGNTPAGLTNLIERTFGQKKVIYHSIVVPENDLTCKNTDRHEEYGMSYIALSTQTNGVVGSVCAADYAKQLKFMGEKVQQVVHSWELECEGAQDLSLTNSSGQPVKMTMTVDGRIVRFSQSLPAGDYSLDYTCLVPRN